MVRKDQTVKPQVKKDNIKRVLVANDSLEGLDVALQKAAMIEHYSGAEIRVVETLYDRIAEEPADVLPRQEQARLIEALKAAERQGLTRTVEKLRERVASLDWQLLWRRDAAEAIVEQAREFDARLLIKPVSRHHPLADFLHTPLDWALMRQSPCPVLVSRQDSWQTPRTVLAAVDAGDEEHAALNREILRTAATLAAVLGTETHVVTVYPDLGQRVSDLQVADDFAGIKDDMRQRRNWAVAHLLEDLDLAVAGVHVIEGKPAQVIPDLAARLNVTLTVVGTAARHHLGKLIIGNTAEDLINRLDRDLVTVREPWS